MPSQLLSTPSQASAAPGLISGSWSSQSTVSSKPSPSSSTVEDPVSSASASASASASGIVSASVSSSASASSHHRLSERPTLSIGQERNCCVQRIETPSGRRRRRLQKKRPASGIHRLALFFGVGGLEVCVGVGVAAARPVVAPRIGVLVCNTSAERIIVLSSRAVARVCSSAPRDTSKSSSRLTVSVEQSSWLNDADDHPAQSPPRPNDFFCHRARCRRCVEDQETQ